jgi:hypothetical protein
LEELQRGTDDEESEVDVRRTRQCGGGWQHRNDSSPRRRNGSAINSV